MAGFGLCELALWDLLISNLNCVISVSFSGFDLGHYVSFLKGDDGGRQSQAVLVKSGHAGFGAKQSNSCRRKRIN
jgi:hypothetical protein